MQLREFVCHFSLCTQCTSSICTKVPRAFTDEISFLYFEAVANVTQCLINLNFPLWFTSSDALQPKLEVCGRNTLVLLTGFLLYVFSGIICLIRMEKKMIFVYL